MQSSTSRLARHPARLALRAAFGASTLLSFVVATSCAADEGLPVDPEAGGSSTTGGSAGTGNGAKGGAGGTAGSGTGGSSVAGGTSATGGASATGGTAAGGTSGSAGRGGSNASGAGGTGTAGGMSVGGASGSGTGAAGGMAMNGGQGGAGMGGRGGMSMGGAPSGGTGTAMGGSGGSGGKPAPSPSMGCGKASPQTGSSGSPLNVSNHQYYVKLPSGYDASKPYPVIFMFNPTGNPLNWAEQNAGYEKNAAKDAAIRVYPGPLSMSNGWGSSDVSFFEPLYTQILGAFCVDQERVFAAGESSGGDFVSILGCEHGDKLRAVAPCATKDVGGYPLDTSKRMCKGEVTAIVIHGKNDNVVGPENGPKTRDFYVKLNHCDAATEPVMGYTDTKSNCIQYQGCDDGFPVYWCQHTDPEYSNTNHGWPHFAADMTWGVFSSY